MSIVVELIRLFCYLESELYFIDELKKYLLLQNKSVTLLHGNN